MAKLAQQEQEILEKAARIMTGKWDEQGSRVRAVILPVMMVIAEQDAGVGSLGRRRWQLHLKALGRILLTMHDILKDETGMR